MKGVHILQIYHYHINIDLNPVQILIDKIKASTNFCEIEHYSSYRMINVNKK